MRERREDGGGRRGWEGEDGRVRKKREGEEEKGGWRREGMRGRMEEG